MKNISVYFTTRNCLDMNYPFQASIKSSFEFADEIIVSDTSNINEGTKDILQDLSKDFGKNFKIITPTFIDWNAKNSGIYDGLSKAFARESCTGVYCWQQDVDEVIEQTPDIRQKIENLASKLDKENPLISTLVVEYWGSTGKVRIDINSWKERLSLNDPNITHGIPMSHRKLIDGLLYSHQGSDGCNVIYKNSGQPVNCLNFVTAQSEDVRRKAVVDQQFVPVYENWVNKIGDRLPVVHHYSWWSVYSKMEKYKKFWNNSWQSLYCELRPKGYNPFFDRPFEEVSEQEMRDTAKRIEEETAGHIFHMPYVSGVSPKTNSIRFNKPNPKLVEEWCDRNRG